MVLPSYNCVCCNHSVEESLAYLFIHRTFAQAYWSSIGLIVGHCDRFVTLEH